MNTRLPKLRNNYKNTDLRGLSAKCDMFIFKNEVIKKKEIPKIIFISAYYGEIGVEYFIDNILPSLSNKFNLIIGSEDYSFPYGIYDVRKNQYAHLENKIFETLFKNEYLNIDQLDSIKKEDLEIFTKGHKNPQGITLIEGKIYSVEVDYPRAGKP